MIFFGPMSRGCVGYSEFLASSCSLLMTQSHGAARIFISGVTGNLFALKVQAAFINCYCCAAFFIKSRNLYTDSNLVTELSKKH